MFSFFYFGVILAIRSAKKKFRKNLKNEKKNCSSNFSNLYVNLFFFEDNCSAYV